MCSNKNYWHKFDEKLKEQVFNTYKFSNHDNNKFILLFGKGIFPYLEYIDDWEKFKGTSLPEKADFYSDLSMKDNTDADYKHTRRVKFLSPPQLLILVMVEKNKSRDSYRKKGKRSGFLEK